MNLKDVERLLITLYMRQIETGQRFSVELEGPPGCGKSELIPQVATKLAKKLDKPFASLPFFLSTVEQPDVRGYGLPDEDENGDKIMTFTKAPWVPKAEQPEHGFIHLDEFRQAGHDVQKPAAELLLNGRVGESELPITYMVIACSNREKDRSGVQRELAFIANRRMLVRVQPHLDSWVEWAETNGVHWTAIAFAKANPGEVFGEKVPEKGGAFCTPRTLVIMSHLIDSMPIHLFTESAAGLIGEGVAAKFVAFLRVVDQLPKYEEIIAEPEECKLPAKDRPDAQYATMQMIAHRVEGKDAPSAFKYLKRMPQEFQVAGLKATLRRCPSIVQTSEFSEWLRENKDLILAANLVDRN